MNFLYFLVVLVIALVNSKPTSNKNEDENRLFYYYFPYLENQTEIIFNNTASLQAANLKPNTKTYFLIDGFQAVGITPFHIEFIRTFAGRGDINVIVVDWQAYSGYGRPVGSAEEMAWTYAYVLLHEVPEAGADLAEFILYLEENNIISFQNATIFGVSLGCHTAGLTGRQAQTMFNKTVGRVVGLDPAMQFSAVDAPSRLRIGDAAVVETYNTNRGEMGDIYPANGDLSIYVNGGDRQPCNGHPLCHSHIYGYKLYSYLAKNDTITACPCRGAACECYECEFECGEDAIKIGPHTPQDARGSYHVRAGYLDWS